MKIAHLDKDVPGTLREQLEAGRQLETDKQPEQAIKLYNGILKKKPLTEVVYNRLMIVYRKMKDYESELKTANTAIKIFEDHHAAGIKTVGASVKRLSQSIGKSTGLVDKKGKSVFDAEPVATWKKRKQLILKRMKK